MLKSQSTEKDPCQILIGDDGGKALFCWGLIRVLNYD